MPWAPDIQVIYEHFHRYLWLKQLVRGKHVLDVGSGEGFGSAILAETAASVLGIDIDETAVRHSALNYRAPTLAFQVGSALKLERLAPRTFDVIVAFELIEHVDDHERVLAGMRDRLAPDGIVVISTPDRRLYTEATGTNNPYHARELDEREFRDLLAGHFTAVQLFGQRAAAGSRILSLDDATTPPMPPFTLQRTGDEWVEGGTPATTYLLAVASNGEIAELPSSSTLDDYDLTIAGQWVAEADRRREQVDAELARTRAELARLESDRAGDRDRVTTLQRELDAVSARCIERQQEIEHLRGVNAAHAAELQRVRESVVWSAFQRVRGRLYGALGGTESRRARAVQWSLQTIGGRMRRHRREEPPPAHEPIRFSTVEEPLVSIVIAAYVGAEITAACLRSIADRTEGPTYEVIVVDDADDEDNRRLWAAVEGATILVNDEGIGYLRSVNRGASVARGRYLVLLNNDVEVEPGWLRALVARAESADDVGAVAPKLIYPDGTLQEAGAIIFRDGNGWNFGRGGHPDHHGFNYAREVDYGSAACLLVRRDLFKRLGGFDERYVPMYYEDTDLCFAVRDLGYRVMFEPRASVIHHEGASAGTDVSSGGKRYQELNRPKFVDKWRATLERDHAINSPASVRRASNRAKGPHVLVVDHRVPTPDQDSGSLRMYRLLEVLLDLGCRVTFVPDDLNRLEPYTGDLQARGVEVVYGPAVVDREIAAIAPDLRLAILSRPYVASRYLHSLREHAPNAIIAYDTVDLHFVREQRRAEVGEPHAFKKAASLRELELGLVRSCDTTIVVSEEERELLAAEVPDARVLVVPNANHVAATVPPASRRDGILFIGGFEHDPNVDAAVLLVRSIMPKVWQRVGDVPVTIAGSKPTDEVRALAGPRVEVTGWVEDLQPLIDGARMLVAPLRYGAGMKGKVTQSLGAGLPVVTTPTGAEGLSARDGEDMLIAEDVDELAERIVRLLEDDALWARLSAAGQEVVRRAASVDVMREQMSELLATAQTPAGARV